MTSLVLTSQPIAHPALRWYGGKFRLSKWIFGHFPQHHIYVEPFGGSYSVGLEKISCDREIYNIFRGMLDTWNRVRSPNWARVSIDPALKIYGTRYKACQKLYQEWGDRWPQMWEAILGRCLADKFWGQEARNISFDTSLVPSDLPGLQRQFHQRRKIAPKGLQ